jgi:GTP-binding protein
VDFIDEVTFSVQGGRGGDGCTSFRREKFVPKGGPDGGDGGNGGNVILSVSHNLSTLFDLKHRKHYRAGRGGSGGSSNKQGKRGNDVIIAVPQGTIVYDGELGIVDDLVEDGRQLIIARGGRGGRGNARFATSTLQAPDRAEEGKPGEEKQIRLELKLLADAGLVGLPNAGKSTLLSRISSARPRIADYPFTTLTPNLGIVRYREFESFVMADIPGLIEGAHEGKGLGDRFLRHIERTSVLVFLIDASTQEQETTLSILQNEVRRFGIALERVEWLVALTKIDLLTPEEKAALPETLLGKSCHKISSVTGEGLPNLLDAVYAAVQEMSNE